MVTDAYSRFVTISLPIMMAGATITGANAETYSCTAAYTLSEVYAYPDFSIHMQNFTDRKTCHFFVNSAIESSERKTRPCKAVDVLAEIYYPNDSTIRVSVFQNKEKKICRFSINGARKHAAQESVPRVKKNTTQESVQSIEERIEMAFSSLDQLASFGNTARSSLYPLQLSEIIGRNLMSIEGDSLGEVIDLVADKESRLYVVVSLGGASSAAGGEMPAPMGPRQEPTVGTAGRFEQDAVLSIDGLKHTDDRAVLYGDMSQLFEVAPERTELESLPLSKRLYDILPGEYLEAEAVEAAANVAAELAYLLAAAGPDEDGEPPAELQRIVGNNQRLFEACIFQFYSGWLLPYMSDEISCRTTDDSEDDLEIIVSYGKVSYALYIPR